VGRFEKQKSGAKEDAEKGDLAMKGSRRG